MEQLIDPRLAGVVLIRRLIVYLCQRRGLGHQLGIEVSQPATLRPFKRSSRTLFRCGVPGMAERARVDPGQIRIAMTQQDRQHSECLTWARVGLLRASGHNSASLPYMGWGLHCSGQIARLTIESPSR